MVDKKIPILVIVLGLGIIVALVGISGSNSLFRSDSPSGTVSAKVVSSAPSDAPITNISDKRISDNEVLLQVIHKAVESENGTAQLHMNPKTVKDVNQTLTADMKYASTTGESGYYFSINGKIVKVTAIKFL